jgi:hypothetical protein
VSHHKPKDVRFYNCQQSATQYKEEETKWNIFFSLFKIRKLSFLDILRKTNIIFPGLEMRVDAGRHIFLVVELYFMRLFPVIKPFPTDKLVD